MNSLLDTGDDKIFQVESSAIRCSLLTWFQDSPNDPFWGTGSDGKGQNQSGVLLMEMRSILRDLLVEP